MKQIPFLDLPTQYKDIKKDIDEAIQNVLDSGVFIGGQEVENLEKEIAALCETTYAVGLNSGTDALVLSLKALGVGHGDEVLTAPFTFIASASSISHVGATPVFLDIDEQTFNIDAAQIEEKITKKTKAILPVHIFGQLADMDAIMEIAKKHNLFVVEDAAQAIGSEYKGKRAGSFGDAGCFSFFPTKNLGAYGDGGMITTNRQDLFEKILSLKNHGSTPHAKYAYDELGYNSRLDALQAAILRVKLSNLESWNEKRAEKATRYSEGLETVKAIETPIVKEGRTHVFHQYTIRVKEGKRNALVEYLQKKGIATNIYYPISLHVQKPFSQLNYKEDDFPVAEAASQEVVSLPVYPELSEQDQEYIISEVKQFFNLS